VIRAARRADAQAIARVMGEAFEHDPITSWFWRDPARRRDYIAGWYALVLDAYHLDHGEVLVAEEGGEIAGCAMWSRPGEWRFPPRVELRTTRYALPRLGLRAPLASVAMRRIEREHPPEPHWYLSELGVRPQSQGRGLGSRLMFDVLARCDRERVPAYLEASTERSRTLYERHGFDTRRVIRMPRGGPPLWLMWRRGQTP
jgi:ribosomal protein S18 acetylase RimI-like enzyme